MERNNEPPKCTPSNGCCCVGFGCSVKIVALVAVLNCFIAAAIFLTIGIIIKVLLTQVPEPDSSRPNKASEESILAYLDEGRTLREKLRVCKTIFTFTLAMAIIFAIPLIPSFLICCVKKTWVAILWLVVYFLFEIGLAVGYYLFLNMTSGCFPSETAMKEQLKVNYDLKTAELVLYIFSFVQTVPGIWLMHVMLSYMCYLRATRRVAPERNYEDDAERAESEDGSGLARRRDEVEIDLTASHESRLLGHSSAAVQQPSSRLKHPEPPPAASKRRFRKW